MSEEMIWGRENIAAALGRSEKTVSRWIEGGHLEVRRAGPYPNSAIVADRSAVEKAKRCFCFRDKYAADADGDSE